MIGEATAVIPAPSATILLLRDRGRMEVLMVKRGEGAHFGSALVFPGGKRDSGDLDPAWDDLVEGPDALNRNERGMRIAGWREVFEETGLLPGACADGLDSDTREGSFFELIRRSGARLPLGEMHLIGRWITPHFAPKRFDTHFYICALDGDEAVCDGLETVFAEWTTPQEALAKGLTGDRKLLFPTKAQLHWLAESESIDQAIAAAAARTVTPIEPRREVRDDGIFVTIPSDAGYVICEERIGPP